MSKYCGVCEYQFYDCTKCPNYGAPIIAQCCNCGCDLIPGAKVFETENGLYCWDCVENSSYYLEVEEEYD